MIGQAIKAIREEHGITQYELAKRLGYSQSNISKYENGDLGIDATFLIKIARAMEILCFSPPDNVDPLSPIIV